MTLYDITLSGCDDSTDLVDVELTDAEHAAIVRVTELANAKGGGCMPTMRVVAAPAAPPANEFCHECWDRIDGAPATRRRGDWVHTTCPDAATSTPETGA